MNTESINRRAFVKRAVLGMASLSLLPYCTLKPNNWHFFTDAEAKVVIALAEQIIPADKDAGATEAEVIHFIDKQLMSHYSRYQQVYRTAIAGVQETSQWMFKNAFEELESSQQFEVMVALENGTAQGEIWEKQSPQDFFELIREHTMQGFYGSPRHGGNKNYVSYKMIGLDYPQIIGQNRY
jgi:gluconate 2-dehydrogenase gamma chain